MERKRGWMAFDKMHLIQGPILDTPVTPGHAVYLD